MWGQLVCLAVLCVSTIAQDQKPVIQPPSITIPTKEELQYHIKGKEVRLACNATAKPTNPLYLWKFSNDQGQTWDTIRPNPSLGLELDTTKGFLTINDFHERDAGMYLCVAEIRYIASPGAKQVTAASFSPIITLKLLNTPAFKSFPERDLKVDEFSYYKMTCEGQIEKSPKHRYSWYKGKKQIQFSNDRFFIDSEGTLHFAYVLQEDATTPTEKYTCALGNDALRLIVNSSPTRLEVNPVNNPTTAANPQRVYSNTPATAKVNDDTLLECMFSGYDPTDPDNPMPKMKWSDGERDIENEAGRYQIENKGRRLRIMNVQEKDSGPFTCIGSNSAESTNEPVTLKVVSPPIFNKLEDGPHNVIKPEGNPLEVKCDARSARDDDVPPQNPVWYINGEPVLDTQGMVISPSRYMISSDSKTLTIKNLDKKKDNGCVQCMVTNSYGLTMKDGCITVLLPIQVTWPRVRNVVKTVKYGDVVDMTVTATTDLSQTLNYQWFFKNETHSDPDWIPFGMFYDPHTKEANINTSMLEEEEFNKIEGMYTRRIWHQHQEVNVTITLQLDVTEPAPVVQSASFDMWIIGLIIGIIFLIVVVVIIILIICRKQQEGDYNVDKKEHGAGLDPEKELKNKGFDDYSRPDYADYDYPDRKPRGDLEYDDVPIGGDDESLGEYGDEATYFNEDGSFIGIYQKKEQPTKNHHGTESAI